MGTNFVHLFSATWPKVAKDPKKWVVPVWLWSGGGMLFYPTFRYHQFEHGFQWCMKCVQSCVKICLEKLTSHDLTSVETWGWRAFQPIWTNLRFRRLINISLSINERPKTVALHILFSSEVHINETTYATVITTDISTTNGVIHIIDRVLKLPIVTDDANSGKDHNTFLLFALFSCVYYVIF